MDTRNHFVDWLRDLAFFLLIFFHCIMPFATFTWEINNDVRSEALTRVAWWMHQWRLPLLFTVSGFGIHYSLQRRSVLKFAGERIVRLFIPLLFAMFFTVPIQIYYEWLQDGKIDMSYRTFYPQVWEMVPYPEGALTWSHMWFVVYLFVYVILLLPVFAVFKHPRFASLRPRLATWLSRPSVLPFLFIPLATLYILFFVNYPEQRSLLDDWFLFSTSMTFVLYGYLLAASDNLWATCEKYRFQYLIAWIACFLILEPASWWDMRLPWAQDIYLMGYSLLASMHVWLIILSAIGFAKRHLDFTNGFLTFTNQAVYPFYILHQTVIVAAGYYVVQLQLPLMVKFVMLVIITFGTIYVLYRFLIKPFVLMRILYGLKPREPK